MSASESESMPRRVSRRTAIQWMLTASAAMTVLNRWSFGAAAAESAKTVAGYGLDPDMMKDYKPGDLWPLTFTAAQRRTAAALCDTIIPADVKSPAASTLGVPDFIDEWISAPYPGHDRDRTLIIEGLVWLDAEAQRRFAGDFPSLADERKRTICDDICFAPQATPKFLRAAEFFGKFRDLTAGGFYSTPAGMKDIGYVGNMPLATFDGPPPEVLRQLGLEG